MKQYGIGHSVETDPLGRRDLGGCGLGFAWLRSRLGLAMTVGVALGGTACQNKGPDLLRVVVEFADAQTYEQTTWVQLAAVDEHAGSIAGHDAVCREFWGRQLDLGQVHREVIDLASFSPQQATSQLSLPSTLPATFFLGEGYTSANGPLTAAACAQWPTQTSSANEMILVFYPCRPWSGDVKNCGPLEGVGQPCQGGPGQGTCPDGLQCDHDLCCPTEAATCCGSDSDCPGDLGCLDYAASCFETCLDYDTSRCADPDTMYCLANACHDRLAQGSVCQHDEECQGGHCADGVCCNEACTEPCHYCNASGICEAVTADEGYGCEGPCTACGDGVCGQRTIGDGSECPGTCQGCTSAGGTCGPITAIDGNGCVDGCTHCEDGSCNVRGAGRTTECSACTECNGVDPGCVPVDGAEGFLCEGPCTSCVSGQCAPRSEGDWSECIDVCSGCFEASGLCVALTGPSGADCVSETTFCCDGNCVGFGWEYGTAECIPTGGANHRFCAADCSEDNLSGVCDWGPVCFP